MRLRAPSNEEPYGLFRSIRRPVFRICRKRVLPGCRKPAGGFSLFELLVAIAIVGILAAIAIPHFTDFATKARIARAISDIKMIDREILLFQAEFDEWPDSLDDIGLGDILDPWKNPYRYLRIDGGDVTGMGKLRKDRFMVPLNSDFDLYSMGADGDSKTPLTAKASRDDIIRASNVSYVGLAIDY